MNCLRLKLQGGGGEISSKSNSLIKCLCGVNYFLVCIKWRKTLIFAKYMKIIVFCKNNCTIWNTWTNPAKTKHFCFYFFYFSYRILLLPSHSAFNVDFVFFCGCTQCIKLLILSIFYRHCTMH